MSGQPLKCLSAKTTHSLAIVLLACSTATAQPVQLEPNPNESGNTISINIGEWFANWEMYLNEGTINNSGTLDNEDDFGNGGTLDNQADGIINNSQKIHNWGIINNSGAVHSSGIFGNPGDFHNFGIFDNSGCVENEFFIFNESAGTFYNRAGGCVMNLGAIENSGTIDNADNIQQAGYLSNSGIVDNRTEGRITNYKTIDNSGTINNEGHIDYLGAINNQSAGIINNEGKLIFAGSGGIVNEGTINNKGLFVNGMVTNAGTINNLGTIDSWWTVDNDGIIDNTDGTFNNYSTLKGTGTFIGNLNNDGGIVAPGNSAGTMTIEGNFTLSGTGILDIEIGGLDPGLFDVLNVTGTADLMGGTINISLLDGYDILTDLGPGESWDLAFLTAAGGVSKFDSAITYNFTSPSYIDFGIVRDGDNWILEAANVVPIPPAILLGGIGLLLTGWKMRRREI